MSTTGKEAMSQGFQRRTRSGPGSANGRVTYTEGVAQSCGDSYWSVEERGCRAAAAGHGPRAATAAYELGRPGTAYPLGAG